MVARVAETQHQTHLDAWAPGIRFAAEVAAGSPDALDRYRAITAYFAGSPESTLCGSWYAFADVVAGLGMIDAQAEATMLWPLAEAGVRCGYACLALSPSISSAGGIVAARGRRLRACLATPRGSVSDFE